MHSDFNSLFKMYCSHLFTFHKSSLYSVIYMATSCGILFSVGISAELYYVRNGIINDYALLFSLPVKADVNTIYFDWQSLRRSPPEPQVDLVYRTS